MTDPWLRLRLTGAGGALHSAARNPDRHVQVGEGSHDSDAYWNGLSAGANGP